MGWTPIQFLFQFFLGPRLEARSPRWLAHLPSRFAHAAKQPTPIGNGRGAPTVPHARAPLRCFSVSLNSPFVSAVGTHLLSSVHTPTRARRGGMACAAAPSPLPGVPARRSTTAPCVVFAVGPHPPRFYRPFKPSTGGAPRSSLRVVASSSKADPVEERLPVAPLADVLVSANASSPSPPVEPQPQVSTG